MDNRLIPGLEQVLSYGGLNLVLKIDKPLACMPVA